MLTPKQHNLLVYIDNFIKETGHSPSFEEMKEAVGLKSKSGIHALINALEERGFIRKLAPVSYTHLDVYKRQARYMPTSLHSPVKCSRRPATMRSSRPCLLYTSRCGAVAAG